MADLIFGDDLVILLEKENLLKERSDVRRLKKILEDIGRHDLAIKLLIRLASGQEFNKIKVFTILVVYSFKEIIIVLFVLIARAKDEYFEIQLK